MQYFINKRIKFTSIDVKLIFKTIEEVQEFQIRMDLTIQELQKARPDAVHMLSQLDKIPLEAQSFMQSISAFRKELSKQIGGNSLAL